MNKEVLDKHRYRRLKFKLMLRTLIIGGILAFAGYFVIYYVIGDRLTHKFLLVVPYYMALVISLYYSMLTTMAKYLDEVVDGIDNVLENRYESVKLIEELAPLENKFNELKTQLERQEEEVRTSESKKNDLILYLAHDLKTPLTSIIAYLNMLETHPDMDIETRKKYVHVAYDKSLRMHQLTQEFFEITKFHLQGIKLDKEEFELDLMLEQIADELYGVLLNKHMHCKFDSDKKLKVHADPDKIARVFDNLLRNAIAYSYPETTIRILARDMGENIKISFTNMGPTIPPQALNNLFDKFYRADNSRNSSTGGAGLGLAIAKEIVNAHGGDITVQSENEVIRFIVTIPKDEIK